MRYRAMTTPHLDATATMHARKRPRHDDHESQQQFTLPPLHAYQHHHQDNFHARPALLPTLSQMLNPHATATPFIRHERPVYEYAVRPATQYSPPHHQPQYPPSVSASPPPSEASMEDEEDEDKTPWPTASEYYALLTDESHKANIPVYDLGVDPRGVPQQPECIYNEPRSCMYFLKCSQLLGRGSFGFPRKKKATGSKDSDSASGATRRGDVSKDFEWRKMSFVTGLPKKQPIVRYITATCYSKTHRSATEKKKVMRMHAVMLANEDGTGETGEYVLVHIRAGGSKRVGVRTNSATATPVSETVTPVASPANVSVHNTASPATSSIRTLLSAHHQVNKTMGERPLTPLMYNQPQATDYSASPIVKRRRGDLFPSLSSDSCPRAMPLWLSPPSTSPSVDHHHHQPQYSNY